VALRAGVGVAAGVLGLLAVCLAVVLLRLRKRHAHSAHGGTGLGGKPVANGAAAGVVHAEQHGPGSNSKYDGKPVLLGHKGGNVDTDEFHDTGLAAAVAVGAVVASARNGSQRQPSYEPVSRRSSRGTPSEQGSDSRCEALVETGKPRRHKHEQQGAADSNSRSQSTVEQTIAHGLERWNAAVSQTTLQLMQRRLQNNNALYSLGGGSGSGSTASQKQQQQQQQAQQQDSPTKSQPAGPDADTAAAAAGAAAAGVAPGDGDLQLHSVIGTGSFGSVRHTTHQQQTWPSCLST
jgi:hypothetical protein